MANQMCAGGGVVEMPLALNMESHRVMMSVLLAYPWLQVFDSTQCRGREESWPIGPLYVGSGE